MRRQYLGIIAVTLLLLVTLVPAAEARVTGGCPPMDVLVLTLAHRSITRRPAFFVRVIGVGSAVPQRDLRPLLAGLAGATGAILVPTVLALVFVAWVV